MVWFPTRGLYRKILLIVGVSAASLTGIQVLSQPSPDTLRGEPNASLSRIPPRPDLTPLVRLGRTLFFDTALSRDGTISCASCHRPDQAFANGKPVAEGIEGRKGTRNTPSLRVAAYAEAQFWDGRRSHLEEQVLDPFFNPNEHGLTDSTELLDRIQEREEYAPLFAAAFGSLLQQITSSEVAQALSAYVRSLKQTDTPLDRYLFKGETSALTPAEQRGLELFRGRARCADCHSIGTRSAPLTDGRFHSGGVGLEQLRPRLAFLSRTVAKATREERDRWISSNIDVAAMGRFVVTLNPADLGSFKTPSLRNVASTAPYMHDGSVATLEEAVEREWYYRSREQGRPVVLSREERNDLLAFMRGLKENSDPPGPP